jgi:Transposase
VVVDHFHAIKLANAVVDQVRRRTQQATLGHHGRKPDPLYRIRKLLLTAAEQLTSLGWVRLRVGPAVGDPTGEVAVAWQGKELLRPVYAASELAHARAALDRFYRWSDGVGVAELSRLARTVRAWEAEILAWHVTGGGSNGPTEAVNLLIKNVKRVGHGFCNFANYRLRLLLHCGVRWQTHRTMRREAAPTLGGGEPRPLNTSNAPRRPAQGDEVLFRDLRTSICRAAGSPTRTGKRIALGRRQSLAMVITTAAVARTAAVNFLSAIRR